MTEYDEPSPSDGGLDESGGASASNTGHAIASGRSIANTGVFINHNYAGLAAALLLVTVLVAGVAFLIFRTPSTKTEGGGSPPTTTSATASLDVRMHEIWTSSKENQAVKLESGQWMATDFPVTVQYLRSIEIAAAKSNGGLVLLQVYDTDGHEVTSQEIAVDNYRAKVVFDSAVDVSRYRGGRLFLVVSNIYPGAMNVYVSKSDIDPRTTSCGPYQAPTRIPECTNTHGFDLSALVVGRREPW